MSDRRYNAIIDERPAKAWPSIVDKTDFKQVLRFFRLLDDPELSDSQKFHVMLKLFFNEPPDLPPAEIIEGVLDFIACRTRKKKEEGDDADSTASTSAPVFCWNADHGRIFAAFWQAYGIDLRTTDMHWWAFNELFQNLPDDTRLMQVIDLRGKKPGKGDSKEQKAALLKAQRAVAIEQDSAADGDMLDDFFNAIVRG